MLMSVRDMDVLRLLCWCQNVRPDDLSSISTETERENLITLGLIKRHQRSDTLLLTNSGRAFLQAALEGDVPNLTLSYHDAAIERRVRLSSLMMTAYHAGINVFTITANSLAEPSTLFITAITRSRGHNPWGSARVGAIAHLGSTYYAVHYIYSGIGRMAVNDELAAFHNHTNFGKDTQRAFLFAGASYADIMEELKARDEKRDAKLIRYSEAYRGLHYPVHLLSCDETGARQLQIMAVPDYRVKISKLMLRSAYRPPPEDAPAWDATYQNRPFVIGADMNLRRIDAAIASAKKRGCLPISLAALDAQGDAVLLRRYLNVTINRAEMLSAIKRASAVAPADSPLDVLRGVLLEADAAAGKLTVTSTNLEAALEEKLPCTVQEDGALVFGAKMLAEMLSRLPQDTVQLCRAENQGRMTLRSGDACYEVDVWERGAFPKPDLPFPEDTVKLSGIPAMAQHTVFATAQDNSKPLLKCVNLMFTSTGLRAAGSNGNCIVTARGDNQSTGDVSLLIPAASLGKLSNMCQDKDEFRVGTTGKSIVFFRENFLFSARLMEGGYIDTDQLVGSIRNAFTVLTDIHDMRAALSSVLSIGTGNRVKLSFQDQRLVFQCAGDCVSASAPIEVIALTGTPAGDYWFNAKQLVTCLKALSGTVTLGIAQGGMLTLATQDAYYLQNAMRPEAQKKTQKAAQPAAAKAA